MPDVPVSPALDAYRLAARPTVVPQLDALVLPAHCMLFGHRHVHATPGIGIANASNTSAAAAQRNQLVTIQGTRRVHLLEAWLTEREPARVALTIGVHGHALVALGHGCSRIGDRAGRRSHRSWRTIVVVGPAGVFGVRTQAIGHGVMQMTEVAVQVEILVELIREGTARVADTNQYQN